MSRHQLLTPWLVLACCPSACCAADTDEIVSRGAAELKADWAAYEDYAWIEKSEVMKKGQWTAKTSRVVFIEASDYDIPAGAAPAVLKAEVARRAAETPDARRTRLAKYHKEREADEALIRDFPDAFTFELTGEEIVDGHGTYVLAATPKKRTGPLGVAAKVLSGMRGTIWLDKETYQAIRVKCEVVRPVPVYGILAKVLPGTHIEFSLRRVTDSVWLLGEMDLNLEISKLFFFHSGQVTRTTYSDYRLNSEVLGELLQPPPSD